ncbi:MAG: HAD family hydrolase [Rhodospirillales bacterium]
MSNTLKAVSFDLWDTLIDDDSDEPKREAQGLEPKPAARRRLLWEALDRHQPIPLEEVSRAFDAADAAFNKAWKEDAVTWPIAERLRIAVDGLGRRLAADELDAVAGALGRMEVDIPPDPVDGVHDALEALAGRYRLAVVSDAIVTPADGLRQLLEGHGLKRYFDAFAFSDEVGRSKPHPAMFEAAARALGVEPAEMVHVGDREANDVDGPKALGMKAVLFTAKRDTSEAGTAADAICRRHADLPAVIGGLAAGAAEKRA